MTPSQDLFDQFDEAITLDGSQVERLESASGAISEFLINAYGVPERDVFLQGSYANSTAVEPVDGGEYDLDLICVVVPAASGANTALNDLEQTFNGDKRYRDRVRSKTPCIRLEYAEDEVGHFHVDIVPSRRSQSAPLEVPRKDQGWHDSAPEEYADWCLRQGDEFARTVKALKRWRDLHQGVRSAIKSIVLQVLVSQHMPRIPDDGERLAETIRALGRHLQTATSPPAVWNPVLPNENLAARWTETAFADFKKELADAETWVDLATSSEDLAETCDAWRDLLGDDFPAPSKSALGIALFDTSHAATLESMGWIRDIRRQYSLSIPATVQRGKRSPTRQRLATDSSPVFAGRKLCFRALGELPAGSKVWWQVVNTGGHARSQSEGLRGGIFEAKKLGGGLSKDERENWEATSYTGSHLIRALAIADNARVISESDWFTVNIYSKGNPSRP